MYVGACVCVCGYVHGCVCVRDERLKWMALVCVNIVQCAEDCSG